jgi:Fic family protein
METYERYKSLIHQLDYYPAKSELMYKYGFTRQEIQEIQQNKIEDKEFIKPMLYSQFGNSIIYWKELPALMVFSEAQSLIRNSSLNEFSDFRDSEMINGFIFSEIESSLAIEGIRSTRARIEQINQIAYEELHDINDIIVKNMLLGYEFVKDKDINEDNIYRLYQILSKNCLKEDELLLPGNYYRHDDVHIVDASSAVVDYGVDYQKLPKLMQDMLEFIHMKKNYQEHLLASHIIHFYLIYLHPYFDYNGRMARVLSFWYNIRYAPALSLLLVSEAINSKSHKNDYYTAISNSRNEGNDITFFLEYMANIILEYTKIYINYYNLIRKLKGDGYVINRSTELALKYVIAMPVVGDGYFDWKNYRDFTNDDFSKTQYLKLLNSLVDFQVLDTKEVKKAKLFKLKTDLLEYH